MAIKKSELYSSLWAGCDALRGGMDASQYKDYVLVLLFIKYVSDKYAGQKYAAIIVPKGASFADLVALKGKPDIGDQINKRIIAPLEKENGLNFGGVDFYDATKLGSGKEMVDRLTDLIAIFEDPALDFSRNRADGDDLLGDAYEYLMRHFATESGKSKGQFYTPAEVSRVIARVLGIRDAATTNKTTVYDPTCGSGSLLLKIGDEARHGGKAVKVTLYGQEKDNATAGLARMNMILHDYATAEIKQGNTLASPHFLDGDQLRAFDYVVANPPFSDKRWSTGLHPDEGGKPADDGTVTSRNYHRFDGYGIPPAKQGDYAYLLHILKSLKSTGRGACILPHGVLFRGNAEGAIRRALVQRGVIQGIIGFPANLFYGTGIPACLVVLDKAGAAARKGIFMIDASRGFRKDGNKNRLREQDIHKIVDTFAHQTEITGYSRLVPVTEIASPKNDYNLNLPRYIDGTEPEDRQDITAHLRGGIPNADLDALDRYWKVLPSVRTALFEGRALSPKAPSNATYSQLRIPTSDLKSAILSQPEFTAFTATAKKRFTKWRNATEPKLTGIGAKTHPKALIEEISEDLLSAFETAPLLDAYDVYQHLMDYWAETMQDDVYLLVGDGWRDAAQPRLIVEDKKAKTKARPDLVVGKKKYQCELIPPALVIARWFAKEQAAVDALAAEVESLTAQLAELEEEHSAEDAAFGSLEKITRPTVKEALDELGGARAPRGLPAKGRASRPDEPLLAVAEDSAPYGDPADTEAQILQRWLDLHTALTDKKSAHREAEESLARQTLEKFPKLTVDEIKTLVVDDKWLATLAAAVQGELDRVSQTLTGRIRQLAERYATPLPALEDEVEKLSEKVSGHLKKMGASWK
ncbi:MAG: SAM-dependent DNA methyltransferase [Candidatus Didemnitutus sp.]|nr:SAM-dependent DNA methyltransferase [Candidatus Didemnitutus sp.]